MHTHRAPIPALFDRFAARPMWVLTAIGIGAALLTLLLMGLGTTVSLVALGLIGLAVVVAIARRWPVATALALPVLIVSPQIAKLYAYEIVGVFITLALIYDLWVNRSPWLLRMDKFEIAVWALMGWAAFSVFWCRDTWWWLFGMRKLLVAAVGLWVAWRLARRVPSEIAIMGLSFAGSAISLVTLAKAYQMGWFTSSSQDLMRRTATDVGWGTANYIAAVLTIILPASVHLALGGSKKAFRVVGWIGIPLTILVVTIAASRGGALMVLIVTLYAIFRARINTWLAVLMGVAAIALLLLGPGAGDLVERFSDPKDLASVVVRLYYYKIAWMRIVEFWPLGMGWGQGWGFKDVLAETDPHNYWLVLVSELGLIGTVLWITVLGILWRYIGKMEKQSSTQALGRSLQLVFVIAMINLMFEPTFQGLQYHFLFYWICGIFLGAWRRQQDIDAAGAHGPAQVPATAPG